jgi:uncharacterized protein YkwD
MWLGTPEMRDALLRPEWKHMHVQVTNDDRFCPYVGESVLFSPYES